MFHCLRIRMVFPIRKKSTLLKCEASKITEALINRACCVEVTRIPYHQDYTPPNRNPGWRLDLIYSWLGLKPNCDPIHRPDLMVFRFLNVVVSLSKAKAWLFFNGPKRQDPLPFPSHGGIDHAAGSLALYPGHWVAGDGNFRWSGIIYNIYEYAPYYMCACYVLYIEHKYNITLSSLSYIYIHFFLVCVLRLLEAMFFCLKHACCSCLFLRSQTAPQRSIHFGDLRHGI